MNAAKSSIIAVGVFDGLHLGHQKMLARLVKEGRDRGLQSVVVTFSSHPGCVLGSRTEELWISDAQERVEGIRQLGVDRVEVLDFTVELSELTACEFVRQVLVAQHGMQALFLGYDTRFGNRSRDDFSLLPQLSHELGFEILKDDSLLLESTPISSTRVRTALKDGDVDSVRQMLGRPYRVKGVVVKGRQVGRQIGFPTVNLDLSQSRKLLPKDGVYSVLVHRGEHTFKGMANLGARPTFGEASRVLEVHLLDFDVDLYGEELAVDFVERLRDIKKFASREELEAQLQQDKARVR